MKKAYIFITLIFLSCTSGTLLPVSHKTVKVDSLEKFFRQCEGDVINAKKVILNNNLIQSLTHLQNMNSGGKRYYLLERESITSMINAVTRGVYTDFILINKKGTVIYTRENDELFGKNVRTSLKDTVLYDCYVNRDMDTFIGDVSIVRPGGDRFTIAVSSRVKGSETMPGIFVLQVDISKIEKFLNEESCVIGHDGSYRVSRDRSKINSQFLDFDMIKHNLTNDSQGVYTFRNSRGASMSYNFFSYSNLRWIILSGN